jgi:opacity protein-like surface antigen
MADFSSSYHRVTERNDDQRSWVESDIALDYLSVPVKINLSFGEPFTVYGNMGIYTGFMVNALCQGTSIRQDNGSTVEISKININSTLDGLFKSVDFGLSGGIGFQVPVLKKSKLDAGISYAQGLTNILKKPENSSGYFFRNDLSFRNSQVSLQIGLQIPISH